MRINVDNGVHDLSGRMNTREHRYASEGRCCASSWHGGSNSRGPYQQVWRLWTRRDVERTAASAPVFFGHSPPRANMRRCTLRSSFENGRRP